MSDKLKDRAIIVTGAAQGIGRVYARRLIAEGAKVTVADIDHTGATRTATELGSNALAVHVDVANRDSVQAMIDATVSAFGQVDVLVNNAALFGPLEYQSIEDITSDLWDRVMAVNVRGVFLCSQAVVPIMKRQRHGKIINIASGTLLSGVPNFVHYVTSKGAVFAFTRALSREVGPFGITVNTLAPGLTMSEAVALHHAPETIERTRMARALPRDETPEDLEGALSFLASSDSDFMTGQMVVVNGGAQFW